MARHFLTFTSPSSKLEFAPKSPFPFSFQCLPHRLIIEHLLFKLSWHSILHPRKNQISRVFYFFCTITRGYYVGYNISQKQVIGSLFSRIATRRYSLCSSFKYHLACTSLILEKKHSLYKKLFSNTWTDYTYSRCSWSSGKPPGWKFKLVT